MNPGNNQKTKTSPVRAAHKKEDSAPKSLKSIISLKNMPLSHISACREASKQLIINHLHFIFKWLTPTYDPTYAYIKYLQAWSWLFLLGV